MDISYLILPAPELLYNPLIEELRTIRQEMHRIGLPAFILSGVRYDHQHGSGRPRTAAEVQIRRRLDGPAAAPARPGGRVPPGRPACDRPVVRWSRASSSASSTPSPIT